MKFNIDLATREELLSYIELQNKHIASLNETIVSVKSKVKHLLVLTKA